MSAANPTSPTSPTSPTNPTSPEPTVNSDSDPEIGEGTAKRALMLKRRFLVALPLGIVVMALSMVSAWQFPGWQWVVAVAALPVVTYCAWPFHVAAFQAARHGSTTMDTLVSLGVTVASCWSYAMLFFGGAGHIGMTMSMSLLPRGIHSDHPSIYFEAATMIVVFLLGGRWAEARMRYRAGDALRELLTLGAKEATVLRPPVGNFYPAAGDAALTAVDATTSLEAWEEMQIPASDLQVGDLMLVRAGAKIPADGQVVQGSSAVDNSLLTGESMPEDVNPGSEVTGAAVNTWGSLVVRATRVGKETTLAQISRMVTEAQATKAPIQRLADTVSSVFVPVIVVLAVLVFVGWLATGHGWTTALTCGVAVLVVACPCALGLATPTALLVGSGRAAQLGIVIRNAEVLEHTRAIDTMVLDKTGTVTTGKVQVDRIILADSQASTEQVVRVSAAVESGSEHPLAQAIRQYAADRQATVPASTNFMNHPGGGVCAVVDSHLWVLGNPQWFSGHQIEVPVELAEQIQQAQASGATVSVLADAGEATQFAGTGADTTKVQLDSREESSTSNSFSVLDSLPNSETEKSAATVAKNAAATLETAAKAATVPEIAAAPTQIRIEMHVGGMTCAACVRRVEKKLSKLAGVTSSVNLATEMATVVLEREYSDRELEQVVNDAGYQGRVVRREATPAPASSVLSAPGSSSDARTASATEAGANAAAATGCQPNSLTQNFLQELPQDLRQARLAGAIVLRDRIRDDAAEAIQELRQQGIQPVLLTGDNQAAADHVAAQVGISSAIAQVLPQEKREKVAELQAGGHQVAMVGDGVNDAAALAQASHQGLGIAMGSGTDLAIAVADITLMRSDLKSVPQAIRISRRTLRTIKGNLFWAFFYNVAMVPLAAAGLLNPMLASAAMAASSVFVVLNSLRLRRCG